MSLLKWISCSFSFALLCACASNQPVAVPVANVARAPAPLAAAGGNASDREPVSDPVIIYVQPPPDNSNEIECRRESRTGSHLSRQRCMTRREREEIRDQAQEWMRSGGINGATMTVQ